jgi:acyl-CoA synthetase (AMP-forming)/AMP-acid ligase II
MNVDSPAGWLLDHAGRRPDAPALDGPAVRLSYGTLASRVLALAADLRGAGVGPGRRVVVALPHEPLAAIAILAVQAAGAAAVPVNREAGEETLRLVLRQTRARHAVVYGADLVRWRSIAPGSGLDHLWVRAGDEPPAAGPADPPTTALAPDGAVDGAPRALLDPPRVGGDAEALVVYTSGSTGQPRGVVQTYRNVAANTRSIVAYLGLSRRDRAMAILPLYYCYGLSVLQTHLLAGASIFLDPRFAYPRVVVDALADEGCTGFAGVPLTFEILRRDVGAEALRDALRRGALRYATQAGGAMAPGTVEWARAALAPARLFVMYGQTEATARLAYLPPERGAEKIGAIGIPVPGVDLRVIDPEGRELPAGEIGELVARGDNVSPGYLDAPDETAAVFRGGALHTGDLAYRDSDGFLFLVGRSKEMLKVGGHRVSPLEIERVLARHAAVLEVAVAGRPDALRGETPVAFVVRRAGHAPSPSELRAFCRRALAPPCVPQAVFFVPALPRSGAGKVLKQELLRGCGLP